MNRPDLLMRSLLISIVLLLMISVSNAQELKWPHENPDEWLLAFIDVETTGLKPGYHEMIDIGIVMTDLDGNELGDLFIRIQPQHPERTEEGARAVNAFDEQRWRDLNALETAQAVDRIVAFNSSIAGKRKVLMVAFNSHFDSAFLDHLFRSQERSWRELYHYFVLDLPSMAWSLGIKSLTGASISDALGVTDEPHVAALHTGLSGAKLNARLYRELLRLAHKEQDLQ